MKLNFGEALEELKAGRRVAREGWNGKGLWLMLVRPYEFYSYPVSIFDVSSRLHGYDLGPFIVIKSVDDKVVPWLASQTDLLGEDWVVVE